MSVYLWNRYILKILYYMYYLQNEWCAFCIGYTGTRQYRHKCCKWLLKPLIYIYTTHTHIYIYISKTQWYLMRKIETKLRFNRCLCSVIHKRLIKHQCLYDTKLINKTSVWITFTNTDVNYDKTPLNIFIVNHFTLNPIEE